MEHELMHETNVWKTTLVLSQENQQFKLYAILGGLWRGLARRKEAYIWYLLIYDSIRRE